MTRLAERLKARRKELDLDPGTLAKDVGIYPQNIYAFESEKNPKTPSIKTLTKLIKRLARSKNDPAVVDMKAASELALAAFDIRAEAVPDPWRLRDEMEFQKSLERGSEVWVLSDVFAEVKVPSVLKQTAENINKREMRYTYFLPFGLRGSWQLLIGYLRTEVKQNVLQGAVRIFELSQCAFVCRLRVAFPPARSPYAVYGLEGPGKDNYLFYPVPSSLIAQIVERINNLLSLEELFRSSAPVASDPDLGSIHRVFPESGTKS